MADKKKDTKKTGALPKQVVTSKNLKPGDRSGYRTQIIKPAGRGGYEKR